MGDRFPGPWRPHGASESRQAVVLAASLIEPRATRGKVRVLPSEVGRGRVWQAKPLAASAPPVSPSGLASETATLDEDCPKTPETLGDAAS